MMTLPPTINASIVFNKQGEKNDRLCCCEGKVVAVQVPSSPDCAEYTEKKTEKQP